MNRKWIKLDDHSTQLCKSAARHNTMVHKLSSEPNSWQIYKGTYILKVNKEELTLAILL